MTVNYSLRGQPRPLAGAEALEEAPLPGRGRGPKKPLPMTAWFHPTSMLRTAFQVMFAKAIHTYVDRREMQANRPDLVLNFEYEKDIWIDYVADLGDGFNPTYAVASLIARRRLQVDGLPEALPRARILVMGGDNVYPTPARDQYQRRTLGPYGAALPSLEDGDEKPFVVSIPGNHDWYDGLTSFLFSFCRRSKIGAWQTLQGRSYFAIKLPGSWWLWGNDIALSNRIDPVQLSYFERITKVAARSRTRNAVTRSAGEEERLILCTASPAWLTDDAVSPEVHRNFWYFESQCVRRKFVPWLSLAGDIHAYARWSSPDGRQRIVSGGGGSYRRGTSRLAREVDEPDRRYDYTRGYPENWKPRTFSRSGTSFPDDETSRRLARRALAFPLRRHNWPFCLLLGVFLGIFAWSLQPYGGQLPGMKAPAALTLDQDELVRDIARELRTLDAGAQALQKSSDDPDEPLPLRVLPFAAGAIDAATNEETVPKEDLTGTRFVELGEFWDSVLSELGTTPATWILPAVLALSFGLFGFYANQRHSPRSALVWGMSHGVAHLAFGLLLMWSLGWVCVPDRLDIGALERAAFYLSVVVVGGLASGALVGLYLVVSERLFGWHDNEVFSAQSIEDYPNFVRMHVERNGRLTIYPIGVRRVPRNWTPRLDGRPGESSLVPADEELEAHLIEGPVRIPPPSRA